MNRGLLTEQWALVVSSLDVSQIFIPTDLRSPVNVTSINDRTANELMGITSFFTSIRFRG